MDQFDIPRPPRPDSSSTGPLNALRCHRARPPHPRLEPHDPHPARSQPPPGPDATAVSDHRRPWHAVLSTRRTDVTTRLVEPIAAGGHATARDLPEHRGARRSLRPRRRRSPQGSDRSQPRSSPAPDRSAISSRSSSPSARARAHCRPVVVAITLPRHRVRRSPSFRPRTPALRSSTPSSRRFWASPPTPPPPCPRPRGSTN